MPTGFLGDCLAFLTILFNRRAQDCRARLIYPVVAISEGMTVSLCKSGQSSSFIGGFLVERTAKLGNT